MEDTTNSGKASKVIPLDPHAAADWQIIADEIHKTLGGHKTQNGFDVNCPAHEDGVASLSIAAKHDKLVWHCKAGCGQDSVREALIVRGLYPRKQPTKKTLVATYGYVDFQKLRYEPKTFSIRHKGSDGKWVYSYPNGIPPKLYRWAEVAAYPQATVVLCEGEKDVDNFNNKYSSPDYVATTNFDGAGKWREQYSDALVGRNVIIFEDNDDPGRKRTAGLIRQLDRCDSIKVVRFESIGPKADFSDWLAIEGNDNGTAVTNLLRTAAAVEMPDVMKKHVPDANRDNYYELITSVLGETGRDIFSGSLMFKTPHGWQKARTGLGLIRAEAQSRLVAREIKFNRDSITDFLSELENRTEEQCLFSIPEWDGYDRLLDIAKCITLDGTQVVEINEKQKNFDNNIVYDYLSYWCANIWRKIDFPETRGVILVFKGPQKIGKDWLINTLTNGFEQWAKDLNINHQDKDNFLQLSSAAVLKIAELDRLSKMDLPTIKAMVTQPSTDIRAPYEAESRRRICRASFAASVNSDDIYRDSTGHTRYVVFNVKEISFKYGRSPEDEKQIIAQGKYLYESNYQLNEIHEQMMAAFLDTKTPESEEDFIAQEWEIIAEGWRSLPDNKTRTHISNKELNDLRLFEKLTSLTGYRLKTIKHILKSKGYEYSGKTERGLLLKSKNEMTKG